MGEILHLSRLIKIHISTIRFSGDINSTRSPHFCFLFVQRGISYIKTHDSFKWDIHEHISAILQVSGILRPALVSIHVHRAELASVDPKCNRDLASGPSCFKWKCAMTNKYAPVSCGRAGTAPNRRRWNGNESVSLLHARAGH